MIREDVPFYQIDLDYNFVMDATKYEFSLNHFAVQTLNADLVQSLFYMFPITKYEFCQHFLINGCFQKIFNKPMERLTLDVQHTFTGAERSLKFKTNYEDMVVEFNRNPTQIYAKVLKKDVTYVEFTQEHKLNFNANKFFLTMKPTLHLHADS